MSISVSFGSLAAAGDPARPTRRFLCALLALTAVTAALAQAPAPSVTRVSPSLPLPTTFAPAPFALPGSTQALEKRLANLLRKLESVQSAEVLIVNQEAQGPTLRVLVKERAGQRLTPPIIATMAEMLNGAVPGIASDHLLIADNAGRVLYDRGQAVTLPPVAPSAGAPWLWLALAVLAALAVAWSTARGPLQRRRDGTTSARAEAPWLASADPRVLAETLARERPEVAALVLSELPEGRARRLRRLLKQRGMVPPVAMAAVETQVVQVVKRSLERALPTRSGPAR